MRDKKRFFLRGPIIIIFFSLMILSDPVELLENSPLDSVIRQYLEKNLKQPSSLFTLDLNPTKRQIIYVMGGSEKNLQKRFKKASQLLHAGMGDLIWIYIQPGITAFDQNLDRNLTNKEWALRQLALLNVPEENISVVDFKEGFWGTLSESQRIFEQAGQQGYEHIHVVTSTYHTRRVWLTFSSFSKKNNISFTVYASNDIKNLRYLLKEYIKLLVYKYILLPLNSFHVTF